MSWKRSRRPGRPLRVYHTGETASTVLSEALADFAAAARQESRKALDVLVEVMKNEKASPSARIAAAEAVLSWGFGRAVAEPDTPVEMAIRWLTAEEAERRQHAQLAPPDGASSP